jgi:predicted nicotinamide N-methyase
VRVEIRPRDLPDSTSDTVDCDTPAARATSTLVTRSSPRLMARQSASLDRLSDRPPPHDLVEEAVALAGRDLAILRPRDSEALLSEEAFEREEFLPYWAELWPSGVALARRIASRALRGARTLELGCGLALPSMAAVLAGGRVLATDWAPGATELARENAFRNGIELETLTAAWAEPAQLLARGPWDLILGADLVYERRNVAELLALLPRLAGPRTEIQLADPRRGPHRVPRRGRGALARRPLRRARAAQRGDLRAHSSAATRSARVLTPPVRRSRCGTRPSNSSASPSASAWTSPSRSISTFPRTT